MAPQGWLPVTGQFVLLWPPVAETTSDEVSHNDTRPDCRQIQKQTLFLQSSEYVPSNPLFFAQPGITSESGTTIPTRKACRWKRAAVSGKGWATFKAPRWSECISRLNSLSVYHFLPNYISNHFWPNYISKSQSSSGLVFTWLTNAGMAKEGFRESKGDTKANFKVWILAATSLKLLRVTPAAQLQNWRGVEKCGMTHPHCPPIHAQPSD